MTVPLRVADHPRLMKPLHYEREMKIICIGAGASGLLFAYKMQKHFNKFDLTVYEKNPDISGTWYENRYPGCACDVPSHNYTWSFEPKTDWSATYASSVEIHKYFSDFAAKYRLDNYIKTQHQVVGAKWNSKRNGYDVQIENLTTGDIIEDYCDILINASGILNNWRWPAIPGLNKYKGKLVHTAAWDPTIDVRGKHVGLIGNGSSGIQVLPALQPYAAKMTTFIREPTWVSPQMGFDQKVFTDAEKAEFKKNPQSLLDYRRNIERGLNGQFALFLTKTVANETTREYMTAQMKLKLKNPYLEQKLIPDWALGCRRLTPGINYLETMSEENVNVVYGEIVEVTENGCVCDDGNEYPTDILICATGFDTSFKPRFPLIGPHGRELAEDWKLEPKSYLGLAAADYPNYLIFLGPNCPIGNGPVLCAIEAQADYMLHFINRWQTENIATFAPKMDAVNDFVAYKDMFMDRTVWNEECRSWYKNNSAEGKIAALWPGSALHYLECLLQPRHDDWDIKYEGNRFAFLGNGYSLNELDTSSDWGYYIRNNDDDTPFLSTGKAREVRTKSGSVDPNGKVQSSITRVEVNTEAEPARANL